MEGKNRLEAVLFGIGVVCFILIMILTVMHYKEQDQDLLDRADYLIARSEASITRWNHGNR
ncbi:MAG: hypothetical protein IKG67_04880 [Parasporobacterium sp.]|nr:hypothetical protein [Parasporobacterium sp.]